MNDVIVEPEEGVYNTCWCATTDKSGIRNGELYLPVGRLGEHSRESADPGLCEKLWDLDSEGAGGLYP